jgi:hypothetical protein
MAAETFDICLRVAGLGSGEPDWPPPQVRVYATRGVESAGGRKVGALAYRSHAVVPSAAWRGAHSDELATLITIDEIAPPGNTIDVLPAPPKLIAAFRAIGFGTGGSLADCEAVLREPTYVSALHDALPLLEDVIVSAEGLQLLGTCVQPGNLRSTTTHVDPDGHESFSGLHVDNWDKLVPGQRHLGRRQMSINLGAHDRFLMFVATSIDTLARTHPGDRGYIGYATALFDHAPETTIFKVRIRPGEMYLAPTDNLIHDGTTAGSNGPDVTLNLRGVFRGPVVAGRSDRAWATASP